MRLPASLRRLYFTPLLAAPLVAQQNIGSPIQVTSTEGGSSNGAPLFNNGLSPRYMAIHSDVGGVPKVITALSFRRNGGMAASAGTRTIDMELWMGDSVDYDRASYVFASNWIGAPTKVLPRQVVNIGPCTSTATPQAFELIIPLSAQFLYIGVRSLAYEMLTYVYTNNGLVGQHDSVTPLTTAGITTTTGAGCVPSGKTQPMSLVVTNRDTAGTFEAGGYVDLGPVNAPTVLALGASNPNLPVPGLCGNLLTDVLVTINLGATDANGRVCELGPSASPVYPSALFSFVLPNVFPGARIYAQAHAIDSGRPDAIKLCNSNGVSLTVPPPTAGAPFKTWRMYTFTTQSITYPNATPVNSSVGWAAVTQFTY